MTTKYLGNNEHGLDVYYDRHNDVTYVELPHTHVGYGSMVLHKANNRAIGRDADRCGQMNIDDRYDLSGTYLAAIVDDYTDEQWELLAELVYDLNDYAIYDDQIYYELEYESQLDAVTDMLGDNIDVEPVDVLQAIFELSLYFTEDQGELWYISQNDFNQAIHYATINNLND